MKSLRSDCALAGLAHSAASAQPNGIALSPEGELFVTDNQGDYKPSTGLLHVEKGDFHGHAGSLKWEEGFNPADVTIEKLWQRVKTPAVVFPHGPMGNSPAAATGSSARCATHLATARCWRGPGFASSCSRAKRRR